MDEAVYTDLMQRFDALADRLVQMSDQYGPDVIDATLAVARWDAAGNLIAGFVVAGLWAALWIAAYKVFRYGQANRRKEYSFSDNLSMPEWTIVTSIGGVIVGIMPAGIALSYLLDPWNWIGVIEPKLWIARRVLAGVL